LDTRLEPVGVIDLRVSESAVVDMVGANAKPVVVMLLDNKLNALMLVF